MFFYVFLRRADELGIWSWTVHALRCGAVLENRLPHQDGLAKEDKNDYKYQKKQIPDPAYGSAIIYTNFPCGRDRDFICANFRGFAAIIPENEWYTEKNIRAVRALFLRMYMNLLRKRNGSDLTENDVFRKRKLSSLWKLILRHAAGRDWVSFWDTCIGFRIITSRIHCALQAAFVPNPINYESFLRTQSEPWNTFIASVASQLTGAADGFALQSPAPAGTTGFGDDATDLHSEKIEVTGTADSTSARATSRCFDTRDLGVSRARSA